MEDLEERKKFIDVNALEKAEKEKENEKKKILLRDQLNQLDLVNQKKAYENQRDKDNDANMLRNNRDPWGKQYLSFKDNLSKKNDRIFGNAEKFNNLLKNPYDPNIFKAKNDDEYNKLMAEAKLREKNKIDPTELEKVNKDIANKEAEIQKAKEASKDNTTQTTNDSNNTNTNQAGSTPPVNKIIICQLANPAQPQHLMVTRV